MKKEFAAQRLDVKAFAQAGGLLSGQDSLEKYERLVQEAQGESKDLVVSWSVRGELRAQAGGAAQVWLHLRAQTSLPLTCQRCLTPVMVDVVVERPFHFVADEAIAAELDDDSEEDVLVLSREFDLLALVEDELLMALPLVPRHEVCPTEVPLQAVDADFDEASTSKVNPFAALASLRIGKPK